MIKHQPNRKEKSPFLRRGLRKVVMQARERTTENQPRLFRRAEREGQCSQ